VPTTFEFVDIAGLVRGASKGEGLGNQFLANIRETDAIVQVGGWGGGVQGAQQVELTRKCVNRNRVQTPPAVMALLGCVKALENSIFYLIRTQQQLCGEDPCMHGHYMRCSVEVQPRTTTVCKVWHSCGL
jgi:hypothetical protein